MAGCLGGRCICGAVLYELETAPMFVHCCHCTWCQRETGSAFAVNALIEIDRVRIVEGDLEAVETPSNSGQGQRILRCPTCCVAIYSHYAYAGIGEQVAFVRVGTLDDPAEAPPDVHIFTSTRQPFVALQGDAPVCEAYYKTAELWPEESLRRRAALLEKR